MLFNFPNRMLCQVLAYLRDDASLHIGMNCVSQFSQRPWRRDHDQGRRLARPDHLLHGRCNRSREAMLLKIVPIGGLDSAFAAGHCALAHPSRTIAALLVRRRVFVFKYLFDPQI